MEYGHTTLRGGGLQIGPKNQNDDLLENGSNEF
jgi:hypothetical protein